jgi:uncharacterized RmlC-like cupin family protein
VLRFALLATAALLVTPANAGQTIIGEKNGQDIVTVRVTEAAQSKQALPIFTGISGNTAGAKHLSLLKVVIPPGGSAEPHVHKGFESAIYLLQGRVETRYGEGLKQSVVKSPETFCLCCLMCRTSPLILAYRAGNRHRRPQRSNEQEHVVPYQGRND